jgi:hypothetical protein
MRFAWGIFYLKSNHLIKNTFKNSLYPSLLEGNMNGIQKDQHKLKIKSKVSIERHPLLWSLPMHTSLTLFSWYLKSVQAETIESESRRLGAYCNNGF